MRFLVSENIGGGGDVEEEMTRKICQINVTGNSFLQVKLLNTLLTGWSFN
jgi:hypothetical protein